MLRGSITALITPFANGAVDEKAFSNLVDWQIREGTHGLVPVGTTGESPTVSHEEHRRVIEICVEVADKRVPVIAGAGSNSTDEAISLARFAEDHGADAILSVVPYYNKPNQQGVYEHLAAIAELGIPVILYNVPSRTITEKWLAATRAAPSPATGPSAAAAIGTSESSSTETSNSGRYGT